jgi:hypothetical protein
MNKKNIIMVIFVTLLSGLIVCSACSDKEVTLPTPPPGYLGYTDSDNGFFIAYPETWEPSEGTGTLVSFYGPGRVNCGVGKESLTERQTAKEHIDELVAYIQVFDEEFKVVAMEELMIDDIHATRGTFTLSLEETLFKQQLVVMIIDKDAYFIRMTSLETDFDIYVDTFEIITSSFRFVP